MKFLIKSKAYEKIGDVTEYGTIPLKTDGRNFFLKEEAKSILENADEWTDFDELTKSFDASKIQDYKDALTLLSAFGVAEIETLPPKEKGVFVAGEREYAAVSEFLLKYRSDKNNFLLQANATDEYFSPIKVRERQFNNLEYHFMYKINGEILAVIIVGTAEKGTLSTSLLLNGLVFQSNLNDEERKNIAREFILYVNKEFCEDYRRLRILRKVIKTEENGEILKFLEEYDFKNTATLKNELYGGGDVEIYDLKLLRS